MQLQKCMTRNGRKKFYGVSWNICKILGSNLHINYCGTGAQWKAWVEVKAESAHIFPGSTDSQLFCFTVPFDIANRAIILKCTYYCTNALLIPSTGSLSLAESNQKVLAQNKDCSGMTSLSTNLAAPYTAWIICTGPYFSNSQPRLKSIDIFSYFLPKSIHTQYSLCL